MKIGLMNNPLKPIIDEATGCGKAGFDFFDLTIEGPQATTVDIGQLRSILDAYGLSITGHTDPCLPYAYPLQAVRDACFQELKRCAGIFSALKATVMNIHPCHRRNHYEHSSLLLLPTGHEKGSGCFQHRIVEAYCQDGRIPWPYLGVRKLPSSL